jgi:PIN domain nuclease of toxin-antitoxin system
LKHLLDTHVVVRWYLDSPRLSKAHRKILVQAETRKTRLFVSAISIWEIAKLVETGKLELMRSLDECLSEIEANALIEVLPLTARIAAESVRLGVNAPRDPADQLIMATARCHGLVLLTDDERIAASKLVRTA